MRRIVKGAAPECLTTWIRLQSPAEVNLTYENFRDKPALLRTLIAEQYSLCGYTGFRVDPANSHIEHVKPQTICRGELEAAGGTVGRDLCDDLNYDNMIAALTREGRKPFGATAKGGWWEPTQFVSPLDADCETRFVFDLLGDINPRDPADGAVAKTIDVLKLKHQTLIDARRGTLEGFLPEDLLTREYLEDVVTRVDVPVNDELPEFSFVIKSVAEDLLRAIPV
jgi:uncharacterized protein (TIGR02646 family)